MSDHRTRTKFMWAIDPRSPEGHGLLGQFGARSWQPERPVPGLPMLWRTRREVREAIRKEFPADCWQRTGSAAPWRPVPVRVRVTVEVVA